MPRKEEVELETRYLPGNDLHLDVDNTTHIGVLRCPNSVHNTAKMAQNGMKQYVHQCALSNYK